MFSTVGTDTRPTYTASNCYASQSSIAEAAAFPMELDCVATAALRRRADAAPPTWRVSRSPDRCVSRCTAGELRAVYGQSLAIPAITALPPALSPTWHRMVHVAKRTMPVPATWSSTRTSILTFYMGIARDVSPRLALRHPRRQAALARPGTAGCSFRVGFAAALDRISDDAWVGAALQSLAMRCKHVSVPRPTVSLSDTAAVLS
jgi:hypothetical protein